MSRIKVFGGLGDGELRSLLKTAADDLNYAAEHMNKSEWHQLCFAATVVYAQELSRRGLRLKEAH